MKPFLKWVGGKTQILDEVLGAFPSEINNYYEPFLGGGSVLLGFLSSLKNGHIQVRGRIYASDINSNLIHLYKNIQSFPQEFIAEMEKLQHEFNQCATTAVNRKATHLGEALSSPESYYFWIRSRFNAMPERSSLLASAMLLFMNKTCFRGVYREGPNGFNVPFGNYKTPGIFEPEYILAISDLIQQVVFSCSSFQDAVTRVETGDFVYFDPPYAPECDTSFVGYTPDGFGIENHKLLFKTCHTLHKKNVKLLLSNADVALVKEQFTHPPYSTRIISCRRAINSKKPEAKTNEVLITNA
jgi:DNA adenine methylase